MAIPKGFRGISDEICPKIRGIATPVCGLVRNDTNLLNNNLYYLHHIRRQVSDAITKPTRSAKRAAGMQ